MARVLWNKRDWEALPHIPNSLYAMDVREVARRLGMSRGLVFILEKSALTKLRRSGQMQQLFELAQLKASLRAEVVPLDGGA